MARKLARRTAKTAFFLIVMFVVARSIGNPEMYVNHDLASKLAQLVSGDVNAESIYDAYFYIDVATVMSITTAIYLIAMKLIKKINRTSKQSMG